MANGRSTERSIAWKPSDRSKRKKMRRAAAKTRSP